MNIPPYDPTRNHPELPISGTMEVDYTLSWEQMRDYGRYSKISSKITVDRFPIAGKSGRIVAVEWSLLHPNCDISPGGIRELIGEENACNIPTWRPARTEHMFCFGAKFPEYQLKFPIIGLDVSEYNFCLVLEATDSGYTRFLNTNYIHSSFIPKCRFLRVREVLG